MCILKDCIKYVCINTNREKENSQGELDCFVPMVICEELFFTFNNILLNIISVFSFKKASKILFWKISCKNKKIKFLKIHQKSKNVFWSVKERKRIIPHHTISIIKLENQKLFPGTTAGAMGIPVGNFITAFSSHSKRNYEHKRQLCKWCVLYVSEYP